MPIRRTLIGCRSIQNGLVAEPGADQLHADRHSFRTDAAGKGAAWQTEHAGEAQQIGMIVARVAGVVAIASYAVDEERRDSGGSRRCDDVDFSYAARTASRIRWRARWAVRYSDAVIVIPTAMPRLTCGT